MIGDAAWCEQFSRAWREWEEFESMGPVTAWCSPTRPFWPLTAPLDADGPDLDESRQAKPYGGEPSCL